MDPLIVGESRTLSFTTLIPGQVGFDFADWEVIEASSTGGGEFVNENGNGRQTSKEFSVEFRATHAGVVVVKLIVKEETTENFFVGVSQCSILVIEPPTGACRSPNDGCSMQTEADCTAVGGTYEGDDTTCDQGGGMSGIETDCHNDDDDDGDGLEDCCDPDCDAAPICEFFSGDCS